MKWKDYFDCWEEIFNGAVLQFPIYFIVGWWVLPIMLACGLLWRLGGVDGGTKLARRIGVPLIVCSASFLANNHWVIFLAVPFMVWLNPISYGKEAWLYKILKNDFLVRNLGYLWYWSAFSIAYCLSLL